MQLHYSFLAFRWTIQVIKAKVFCLYSQISGAPSLKKAIPFLVLTLCLQANITDPEVGYYTYIKIYPNRVPTPDQRQHIHVSLSQWYGHPHSPWSITLMMWASPVTLTLTPTQVAKVIWKGDAHISRVLGMGMPKPRGYPYQCDSDTL